MQQRLLALLGVLFLAVVAAPEPGSADVYVFKNRDGVLTFTNVPNHGGYRRVLRDTALSAATNFSSSETYEDLIRSASRRHSIDADLIRAVIKNESDFNSTARSNKGAMGLMQLMPDTARLHNVIDAYNPLDNIEGGVRHLKMLLERFRGDLELSLAAYNAGIKAVEKFGGIPPFAETKEYVRRVLHSYQSYRGNGLQIIRAAQN
jgi:soluble lytic murein transglycosylase-like protein